MKTDENIRQELESLGAHKLEKLKGETARWSLPQGYFDGLSERVLEKEATLVTKKRRLFARRWLAAAASILVLLAGSWLLYHSVGNDANNADTVLADWETIADENITNYIDQHLDDFDLALLADFELELTLEVWGDPALEDLELEELLDETEDWTDSFEEVSLF